MSWHLSWKRLPAWVLAEYGVDQDWGADPSPVRLPDGGFYAMHVHAPSGRRWWEPADGRPVIPFGLQLLEPEFRQHKCLAICEGESDAMAVAAALGAEGLDVIGIPGANTWRPAWTKYAAGYGCVYVLGDGDEPGRNLNAAVRRDIPDACVVNLPAGEDVRRVAQRDVAELVGLLSASEWLRDETGRCSRRRRSLIVRRRSPVPREPKTERKLGNPDLTGTDHGLDALVEEQLTETMRAALDQFATVDETADPLSAAGLRRNILAELHRRFADPELVQGLPGTALLQLAKELLRDKPAEPEALPRDPTVRRSSPPSTCRPTGNANSSNRNASTLSSS